MDKQETNRDLTFDQFSDALSNRSDYCSSCKYFERHDANKGYCSKHDESRSPKSQSCSKWRLKY